MSGEGGLQFLNPAWLLLLPLVWWLSWRYAQRYGSGSMWQRWCDTPLLARMTAGTGAPERRRGTAKLLALVLTAAIAAAAGPSWRKQPYPLLESAAARVLVLSLSRSMLVEDVEPSRMARATSAARELLAAEFNGETGLVVFAGAAFVVSPLSSDSKTLLAFLDALSPQTMPLDGARVDLAIGTAQGLLEASVAGKGQILVLTDSISDVERAAGVTLEAARRGHRVSVIAVGTSEGGPLKTNAGGLVRDDNGNFILAKTDFAALQRIAQIGGGSLIHLEPDIALGARLLSAANARSLLEAPPEFDPAEQEAVNEGIWIVWLMLPFTLILFRRGLFWVLLLACWLPIDAEVYARDFDDFFVHAERRAFAAFQQGDYQRAFDLSSDPMLKAGACYRLRRFACAAEYYRQQNSAEAFYNLGNTHAQLGQFPDAVVAYAQALSLNPRLETALINQRLIEAYLQQQAAEEAAQAEAGAIQESLAEESSLGSAQARIGMAGQASSNPGDNPQAGAGLGASTQSGSLDPEDPYDGGEQRLEDFILQAAGEREAPDPALVERWLKTLPESSAELFRRKFLRDYQRQIRQER